MGRGEKEEEVGGGEYSVEGHGGLATEKKEPGMNSSADAQWGYDG